MHDLVIRNGSVVDGTGAPTVAADVAIDGDRVVAVGRVDGDGQPRHRRRGMRGHPRLRRHPHPPRRAAGLGPHRLVIVLARGHLRRPRQLRGHLRPVQGGRPRGAGRDDGEVEDIPRRRHPRGTAPGTGRATASTSTPSNGGPRASTWAAWSGTARCGSHAMGERSLSEEPATADDIAAMCELVDEAIGAGALGFSTSRTLLHRVPDGRPVPGTWATAEELIGHRRRSWAGGDGACSRPRPAWASATATTSPPPGPKSRWMGDVSIASGRPAHLRSGPQLPPRRPLPAGRWRFAKEQTPAAPGPPADDRPRRRRPVRPLPPDALRRLPGRGRRLRGCCRCRRSWRCCATRRSRIAAHRGGRRAPGATSSSACSYVLGDGPLDYAHDPENTLTAVRRPRGG